MKTIPTFITHDKKLLTGPAARKAWAAQEKRCPCGYYGEESESVSGTCQDMPAEWIGCANPTHTGQALGMPLIYRTPGQLARKLEEMKPNVAVKPNPLDRVLTSQGWMTRECLEAMNAGRR